MDVIKLVFFNTTGSEPVKQMYRPFPLNLNLFVLQANLVRFWLGSLLFNAYVAQKETPYLFPLCPFETWTKVGRV